MALTITLPGLGGATEPVEHVLAGPGDFSRPTAPITSRKAYAAAHVIPVMSADNSLGAPPSVDWEATLAQRHELWSYGLGVADAMDTAQRGMGVDWPTTRELIRRSATEAARVVSEDRYPALSGLDVPDLLACGAGTDQLDPAEVEPGTPGLQAVRTAYLEQIAVVEETGAKVIIMASRALARAAVSAEDYLAVYSELLDRAEHPVILHWLGPMFDPALTGYWGSEDIDEATETFLALLRSHTGKIDGVKVSLLDAAHERRLRAALPEMRLYTGDDFHYPELMHADEDGSYSDALLGVFAAIYPAASMALQAYDAGQPARGREMLDSTQALGRHLFSEPTYHYKTGVAFLAWLNGHQSGFQLVGGLHAGRSVAHLIELFRLADAAGLLLDPELAVRRMRSFLTVSGVSS